MIKKAIKGKVWILNKLVNIENVSTIQQPIKYLFLYMTVKEDGYRCLRLCSYLQL